MNLGYLVGTAIFLTLLIALVWWQITARRFHPYLYWATVVASTTAGTTMADFATRSLGVGYPGGSLLLHACVMGSLILWRRTLGSISADTVVEPRAEVFYWVTITFSQTLGTALGGLDGRYRRAWLHWRSGHFRRSSCFGRQPIFLDKKRTGCCCFGRRSSLLVRWALPWVTISTSRLRMEG